MPASGDQIPSPFTTSNLACLKPKKKKGFQILSDDWFIDPGYSESHDTGKVELHDAEDNHGVFSKTMYVWSFAHTMVQA